MIISMHRGKESTVLQNCTGEMYMSRLKDIPLNYVLTLICQFKIYHRCETNLRSGEYEGLSMKV